MLLLIDNLDSFTYNIVQAYQQLNQEVKVVRNDAVTPEEIEKSRPSLLVIGPGPGNPQTAGVSQGCVRLAEKGIPIFGICLGHQAIGASYGARVVRASQAIHGKVSPIFHTGSGVFMGLAQGFAATRYHSLVIEPSSLPETFQITAWTAQGEIMAIRHRSLPLEGVQFHPESAASEEGLKLFQNSLYFKVGA